MIRFALAVALAVPMVASAQTPLELRWTSDPACSDKQTVLEHVRRLVGTNLPPTTRVTAEVDIQRQAEGAWTLSLRLSGPTGAGLRTLAGASCEELAAAAELIIALALDPNAGSIALPEPKPEEPKPREPKPKPPAAVPAAVPVPAPVPEALPVVKEAAAPAPPPEPEVKSAAEAPPVPVPVAAPSDFARPELRATISLLGEGGALPGVGAGAQLGLCLEGRRVRLEAYATLLPQRFVAGPRPAAGAQFSMVAGGLRLGLRGHFDLWDAAITLGAEAGGIFGSGEGLGVNGHGQAPWAGTALGACVGFGAGHRVNARLGLEVGVALLIPRFGIEGFGELYTPAPVFGRLYLQASFRAL